MNKKEEQEILKRVIGAWELIENSLQINSGKNIEIEDLIKNIDKAEVKLSQAIEIYERLSDNIS